MHSCPHEHICIHAQTPSCWFTHPYTQYMCIISCGQICIHDHTNTYTCTHTSTHTDTCAHTDYRYTLSCWFAQHYKYACLYFMSTKLARAHTSRIFTLFSKRTHVEGRVTKVQAHMNLVPRFSGGLFQNVVFLEQCILFCRILHAYCHVIVQYACKIGQKRIHSS